MHQIFPSSDICSSGVAGDICMPAIYFEVPNDVKPITVLKADSPSLSPLSSSSKSSATATARVKGGKRPRNAASTEAKEELHQEVTKAPRFNEDTRHAMRRVLEFGSATIVSSSHTLMSLSCFAAIAQDDALRINPSALFAHKKNIPGAPSQDYSAQQQQQCFSGAALRRALSLLCRVVTLDPSGYFLTRVASPMNAMGANDPGLETAINDIPKSSRSFLELYCAIQSLELELEDLQSACSTSVVTSTGEEKAEDALAQLQATIETCINAMEQTIIDIVLTPGEMNDKVPRAYISQLVKDLPRVLQQEAWPCELLGHAENHRKNAQDDGNTSTGLSTELNADVLGYVAEGASAVIMNALHDVRHADSCDILAMASASPVTVLAAGIAAGGGATKRSFTSKQKQQQNVTPRGMIDIESISFALIRAKAWAGIYTRHGLRSAQVEVQALFYRLFLDARDAQTSSSGSTSSTMKRSGAQASGKPPGNAGMFSEQRWALTMELWERWNTSLRFHYAALLSKIGYNDGTMEGEEGARDRQLLERQNVFAILEQCRTSEGSGTPGQHPCQLSDVQLRTLRVLSHLRAVDAEGWFAVPAFDLVNIDFTSVEKWVCSTSFAGKTSRAAFDAVRKVLERMVDCCVDRYGPTHQFSECITRVRQQLVDAARRERLL